MTRTAAIAAALLLLAIRGADAQVRFDERIEVSRVLIDARVVDSHGKPVGGLGRDDFRIEIDGRPARLEWVEWVGERAYGGNAGDTVNAGSGRLVVFLFQKSLMGSRAEGFVRMMREATRFVDRLGESDRVAVLVHDSRLRLWLDFTNDRERLRHTLTEGLLHEPPGGHEVRGASLASRLPPHVADESDTFEGALSMIAGALREVDGAKSLVLFGYGFGRFRAGLGGPLTSYAQLDDEYARARNALASARVSVFALDITHAHFHTLETALMAVAEATGGFYAKTHEFPALAMDRLAGALAGHYVLSVETSSLRMGRHDVRIRVRTPGATVLARRDYVE